MCLHIAQDNGYIYLLNVKFCDLQKVLKGVMQSESAVSDIIGDLRNIFWRVMRNEGKFAKVWCHVCIE